MKPPIITLTTDFGTSDHYVAAIKGVILGICPTATLVDISHNVAPYDIPEGAYLLAQAWRCFPKGTVHLVVVDPGVGSERRAIVAEVAGHRFVAPDNGVLTLVLPAAELTVSRRVKIRELTAIQYFRQPVSPTFHGRDIFAPVAARLAAGLAPVRTGPHIEDAIRLPFGSPRQIGPKKWEGAVLHTDRFGNVVTNFPTGQWPDLAETPFSLRCRNKTISEVARSYEAMQPRRKYLISGSAGYWEISCNQQDAGKLLGICRGDSIQLRFL